MRSSAIVRPTMIHSGLLSAIERKIIEIARLPSASSIVAATIRSVSSPSARARMKTRRRYQAVTATTSTRSASPIGPSSVSASR